MTSYIRQFGRYTYKTIYHANINIMYNWCVARSVFSSVCFWVCTLWRWCARVRVAMILQKFTFSNYLLIEQQYMASSAGGALYNMQISKSACNQQAGGGVCAACDGRGQRYIRCVERAEISSRRTAAAEWISRWYRKRRRDRHTAADKIDVTVTHREISL